MYTMDSV